jgi:hypothetical protein
MRTALFIILLAMMFGCSTKRPSAEDFGGISPAPGVGETPSPTGSPKVALALNTYREMIDLTGYDDLGSFHFRRLHFYSKKNPGVRIGEADVEEITAYFIDRYVVKIRYKLSSDIASYLVDSLTTDPKRQRHLDQDWSKLRQIKWNYFNKVITYQNKCPEDDLAMSLTNEICDSPYWLYVELPGYRKKVRELMSVEKAVHEYLIDDPPSKAESQD